MNPFAEALLKLSDYALDDSMRPLIERWSDPPTSLEILEVLDRCIFSALASNFVVSSLQIWYDMALTVEGKTHEQNVPLATWRDAT